jgi:hypothetical protein
MAYPTVSAPYGLDPINRVDGMAYAGATRQLQIASAYPNSIYHGDLVQVDTNGQVIRSAVTNETNISVVGVFMGCTYTNPSTKQKTFSQYWPGGTTASDAFAYVVDDPMAAFKIAVCSVGTTISYVTRAAIGANFAVLNNTGSATTGDSAIALDSTTGAGTANTYVLRVIDVVPDTSYVVGGQVRFPEVIVKINLHQYNNTTGV